MAEQLGAIQAITANPSAPTFDNTLVPLERSGVALARVLNVLFNKSAADTNDVVDGVRSAYAPKLAAHGDAIRLDPALFARIEAVHGDRDALDPEARYLVERYHTELVLAGAALGDEEKDRLKKLNEEMSTKEAAFELALQADTNDLAVVV